MLQPEAQPRVPEEEVVGVAASPEYEEQRKAYESLWQTTKAVPAPPEQDPPLANGKTGSSLKDRFRKMVGADTFIPESVLHTIKNVGSGSFATGACLLAAGS